MSKRSIRKSIVMLLAFVLMSASTALTAFAAGPNDTPDGQSYTIQQHSSATGTVTLGKILTTNQDNKFPVVTDFNYEITAVKAWKNANISTGTSGETIPVANMPLPAALTTVHQSVTPDTANHKATVTVGDFSNTSATNHDSAAGNDTNTQRTRTTPVQITFSEAGYYMYKVTETGSTPADIKGVDYDKHEYFMVFYVCNKVDEQGNTLPSTDANGGVYVHDITSYRNTSGSSEYQPNLSDIQNVSDNKGSAADGTGADPTNPNTEANLAKVGKSAASTPNQLEAYRMWNHQYTQDLVLKKNVTGNLGDRTKQFEFTIAMTALEPGQTYTTNVAAKYSNDTTTTDKTITSASVGTLSTDKKSFTSDNSGNATILVKLTDEEVFVINALPVSSKYTITEAASDHVATYSASTVGPTAETDPLYKDYVYKNGVSGDTNTDTDRLAATSGTNNNTSNLQLATSEETIEKKDGTAVFVFNNNRDIATITGIPGLDYIIYASAAAIVVLIAYLIIRRRREYDDEI